MEISKSKANNGQMTMNWKMKYLQKLYYALKKTAEIKFWRIEIYQQKCVRSDNPLEIDLNT